MHALIAYLTRLRPESWGLATYVLAAFALVGVMLGASYLLGGRDQGGAKEEPFRREPAS